MTDKELARWQGVYDRQAERVYRIAFVYLQSQQDAEDALQGIFLRQMEKGKFFTDVEEEKAWFITVTRNYCNDMKKAFWKRKVSLVEFPRELSWEAQDMGEGAAGLRNLVLSLPVKDREVLYLHYFEGYSIREIAGILKRKESTVGSRLAAARQKLKAAIEREGLAYG